MQRVEEKDVVDYNTVFSLLVERVNWSDVIIMQRYVASQQLFKITLKGTMVATHYLLQLSMCLLLLTLLGVLSSLYILEN